MQHKRVGVVVAVHKAKADVRVHVLPLPATALHASGTSVARILKFCWVLLAADVVLVSVPRCSAVFQSLSTGVCIEPAADTIEPTAARSGLESAVRTLFQSKSLISALGAAQTNLSFGTTPSSKLSLFVFRALQHCAEAVLGLGNPAQHVGGTYLVKVSNCISNAVTLVAEVAAAASLQYRDASSWLALLVASCTQALRVPAKARRNFQTGTASPEVVARLLDVRVTVSLFDCELVAFVQ